jgi:hypothetical protein
MDHRDRALKELLLASIDNHRGLSALAEQTRTNGDWTTTPPSREHLQGAACYLALNNARNAWIVRQPTGATAAHVITTLDAIDLRHHRRSYPIAIHPMPRPQLLTRLHCYGPAQLRDEITNTTQGSTTTQ